MKFTKNIYLLPVLALLATSQLFPMAAGINALIKRPVVKGSFAGLFVLNVTTGLKMAFDSVCDQEAQQDSRDKKFLQTKLNALYDPNTDYILPQDVERIKHETKAALANIEQRIAERTNYAQAQEPDYFKDIYTKLIV